MVYLKTTTKKMNRTEVKNSIIKLKQISLYGTDPTVRKRTNPPRRSKPTAEFSYNLHRKKSVPKMRETRDLFYFKSANHLQ